MAVRAWQEAPTRDVGRVGDRGYLAGVGDGLQLQGRQGPAVRGGQGKGVGDVWRRDTGQRASLHHAVRVLLPDLGCGGRAGGKSGVWPGTGQGRGRSLRVGCGGGGGDLSVLHTKGCGTDPYNPKRGGSGLFMVRSVLSQALCRAGIIEVAPRPAHSSQVSPETWSSQHPPPLLGFRRAGHSHLEGT